MSPRRAIPLVVELWQSGVLGEEVQENEPEVRWLGTAVGGFRAVCSRIVGILRLHVCRKDQSDQG